MANVLYNLYVLDHGVPNFAHFLFEAILYILYHNLAYNLP